jgi:UDP-N-acetylmuramoyl-L-alanyl-D-glutamate--2,6-diaminopimelate ligase
MRLKSLLNNLDYQFISHQDNPDILGITCNSKEVRNNFLFVAIKGSKCDGHDFLDEAITKGAKTIIIQDNLIPNINLPTPIIKVPDTHRALAWLCAKFYGYPSKHLKVIGITGTNGKTTLSYLTESILNSAGLEAGLIGTIGYQFKDRLIPATNTTPNAQALQYLLAEMVKAGLKFAVMEVSSHSLDQQRVEAIDFGMAVFTNLTRDHLDYHLSFEKYFKAKAKLFKILSPRSRAIINIDDPYGRRLVDRTKASVLTYAIKNPASLCASKISLNLDRTRFLVSTPKGTLNIKTKLIGRHNVYNILGAIGVGISSGLNLNIIKEGVEKLKLVPGRLETIDCGQPFKLFVDYAHSDDALKNVLSMLRQITPDSKIILVFGCGGEKDKGKRPKMGKIAATLADFAIITSDNPRSEDPKDIACDILKGIKKSSKGRYRVILDRFEAIKEGLSLADTKSIVLIAGKGHEAYQIFKDRKVPFDDREVARQILRKKSC